MSDAPQGQDWWQASDGKWYPPAGAGEGGAPPPSSSGGGGLSSVPVPKVSSGLLGIIAWATLVLGLIEAFWNSFISGPDDFADKIGFFLSGLSGWIVAFGVLLVAAALTARNEA